MMAKFNETHFDEYLIANERKDLHPKICKMVHPYLPTNIADLPNTIVYGAKGVGKYTQVLTILKRYSQSKLKYEKKLQVNYTNNKTQYFFKLSDIHIEVDMGLLGCNAKLLWNEIYNQLIDITCIKSNKIFVVVCKNFQDIHSELLDNFYSYMQTVPYMSIKLVYIIISDQLSFIPDNILNICKILPISRPTKTAYTKCINKKVPREVKVNDINNIKSLSSGVTQLMKPHAIVCDNILNIMRSHTNISYARLRDVCYDIFIYHLDIYECVWYIIDSLILDKLITANNIHKILVRTYQFFKYYNNNYRPIYHLENYVLYLISSISKYD